MSTAQESVDEFPALVIDNGGDMIKAGFGGDDKPRVVFPTIVGRPRQFGIMVGMGQKDAYIGDEAKEKRRILSLTYPIERGIVTNWDNMERIWHHTFYNELRVAPEEHSVLLTDNHDNPQLNREKTTQIMFETFSVQKMNMQCAATLALYAGGRTNGIVIDSGAQSTRIIPVYEGHNLKSYGRTLDIGGMDIKDYLTKISCERGYAFATIAELQTVRDIKEKLGYVAIDFEEEMKLSAGENAAEYEKSYELPDGQVMTYGNERFRCVEAMFQPGFIGKECDGLCKMLYGSVMEIQDEDLRKLMSDNVVLCGGNTLFNGFEERVLRDLRKLYDIDITIDAQAHRIYTQWIGGSILSSLSTFGEQWIDKEEYDEYGPVTVSFRCF